MAYDVDKELEALMANIKSSSDDDGAQEAHFVNFDTPQQPVQSAPAVQKKNDEEYYSGEVYFAARKPARPAEPPVSREPKAPVSPTRPRRKTGAAARKRKTTLKGVNGAGLQEFLRANGTKGALIYVGVLVAISVILSVYSMSFVNDILAFNRSDEVVTVTVSENATTSKLISQFKKQGLIKHKYLCKMFMSLTGDLHGSAGKAAYLSGSFDLTPSMGLEKMLLSCKEVQKADTVMVTIPEGLNVDQIALKLEKAQVCTKGDFYKNLESAVLDFDFVKSIENRSARYNYLEGYLYPDTYEFYVGQSASSVIRRLLENFDEKWTDEYAKRTKELGMTVDEVITLASIIQKEAGDAEQMPIIASVFNNRLKSSSFRCLQSDATTVYVAKFIKPNVTSGEADVFAAKYDTYKCIGLPAGPICCPGDDAIKAVLNPAETEYYFFGHDSAGKMYAAKTEAERNRLMYNAVAGVEDEDK